tara:strand:- start:1064 stop:1837 length:774 start_codon:yes stop_codon:yes gene_type:complete
MRIEIHDKKKCDLFMTIFSHIKSFNETINIVVDTDKLFIQGMDNSHVSVFEVNLCSEWFDVYEQSNNCEQFGINLTILNKILKTMSEKHKIVLFSNDSEDDKLNVEFITEEKGEFNKYFQLPLMDIEVDSLQLHDIEYTVDIIINSKKLKTSIDELTNFDDTIKISCKDECVDLLCNSNEGSMKITFTSDDIEELGIIENESIECSFAIKYLSLMTNFYKLSDHCMINISENIPMQFKYNITETSFLRFFLAPKIDD